jgi:hypothetical protein
MLPPGASESGAYLICLNVRIGYAKVPLRASIGIFAEYVVGLHCCSKTGFIIMLMFAI